MKNIVRLIVITVTLMGLGVVAEAQQPKKIFRIALLTWAAAPSPSSSSPFDQGLLKLGYVEGQNIAIERRYANGQMDRLPQHLGSAVDDRDQDDLDGESGEDQPRISEAQIAEPAQSTARQRHHGQQEGADEENQHQSVDWAETPTGSPATDARWAAASVSHAVA